MKTAKKIQELVKRVENLKKVTDKFAEQVADAAGFVMARMEDAGVRKLEFKSGSILICRMRSSVGAHYTLEWSDLDGDLLAGEIATGGYYVHGDFNCWQENLSRESAVKFAECLPEILEALAKLDKFPKATEVS